MMLFQRRCLDCRNKFGTQNDRADQCPRCARADDAAHQSNIDPNTARPGELGYYNFRHGSQRVPVFHRGGRR